MAVYFIIVLSRPLRSFACFHQAFSSFPISCHFHCYPIVHSLAILSIHRWRCLLLGCFLFNILTDILQTRIPSDHQPWPAYSSRFALRYFPMFGLSYSSSKSMFFLFFVFSISISCGFIYFSQNFSFVNS